MALQRGDESIGLFVGQVEAADEAGDGRAAPVELEPVRLERIHRPRRQLQEDLVGLDRCDQFHPGNAGDPDGDPRRGAVRLRRQPQPQPILDIGHQLGRGEAHLRPNLAGAAQLDRQPIGDLGRKHDDRVAQRAAVLGRAERQYVDPGTPGELGRAALQPRHRIGKARAIHVQLEAARFGDFRERPHLVQPVDGAKIGGLGQIDRRRLPTVDLPGLHRGQHPRKGIGVELAVAARHRRELESAAEKSRGVRLGCVDVRRLAAIDETPRGRNCRERQGVGGGAGGHRKHPDRGLEQLRETFLQLGRPGVTTVTERGAGIGADQRVEDFRRGAAGIVAAKIDHRGSACAQLLLSRLRGRRRGAHDYARNAAPTSMAWDRGASQGSELRATGAASP